jgi:putative PIN family toxin of toxin-antitoxin system
MIVCIDTCVLLQAAKAGHPFHVIFDAWFSRGFRWAVSNEVLTEYQEMIVRHSGVHRWNQLGKVFSLAEAVGGLLVKVQPAYRFQVIAIDPDDNKFTDCAITANADYVITNDAHFQPLASAGYKPQPISPAR